jgi:hypothetical protein
MSSDSEWTRRVDEATAHTTSEQLKTLLREAEEGFARFWEAAAEQARLLVKSQAGLTEAQRALERTVAELREKVVGEESGTSHLDELNRSVQRVAAEQSQLAEAVAAGRRDLERLLDSLRSDLLTTAEESERSNARAATELVGVRERLSSLEEGLAEVRRRLGEIGAETSGVEERAAQRLISMLAGAFEDLTMKAEEETQGAGIEIRLPS